MQATPFDPLAILSDLRSAGFPEPEIQAVRNTPPMWEQLTRFYARGGRVQTISAAFSAANGHPSAISFYVPEDPAQRTHSRYSSLAHELGHALFYPEQWQAMDSFASAEAYARSREMGEAHAWLNQYTLCLEKVGGRSELYFPLAIENEDDFGVRTRDVFGEIAHRKLAGESDAQILEHLATLNANMFPSGMGEGNHKTYGQCTRWDYYLAHGDGAILADFQRRLQRRPNPDEQKRLVKFGLLDQRPGSGDDSPLLA